MKYLVLLGDGMADLPVSELIDRTPLEAAFKPCADRIAGSSLCGMVRTIPSGMEPGSGPANMAVMGFDPSVYYTGRSPIEAVSLGIDMRPEDVVFRCNLVTLARPYEGADYNEFRMEDYSAGEITTAEAAELIRTLDLECSTESIRFYPGRSYRHCMVWRNGPQDCALTPPHDISGKVIANHLPEGDKADVLRRLMIRSEQVLREHPVNIRRRESGKRTADSIWLWGQGTRPQLPSFRSVYGKSGAVISAVDLVFGIGRLIGLDILEVPGATGTLNTDYTGKANAAIRAFESGTEFVYLHVEAPDECGHQGDRFGKVQAIERIDKDILGPVIDWLEMNKTLTGEGYRVLFLPDHPTPVDIRTHTDEPVPFLLFDCNKSVGNGANAYNETEAAKTGLVFESGPALLSYLMRVG